MSQLLTLSRAAHLIGISRGALQKKIRDGELPSFDGRVDAADLLRVWPGLDLESAGAFEKVAAIRDDAFARRLRERVLPSPEVLARRLFVQGQELAELRRTLTRYHDLLEDVQARLSAVPPAPASELLRAIEDGLAGALAAPAGAGEMADAMLRAMSAHVTVKPSGREFFVEGSEPLLKAALRAGLAPGYGCGNGNCGLCKARVIDGETRAVVPSDYRFSAAEKAQGHVLLCACTAASDELVLEVLEAGAPADIPEQRVLTRVRAVRELGPDLRLLHLQTPRSQRLRFLAGQRVTLGHSRTGDGQTDDLHGEYPVASCPCDDRNLVFHIRRDAGADLAVRLFAGGIAVGDEVSVWGPWGDFVLDKSSTRPLLFAAVDHGFAPVASLIEHAISVDAAESFALYWATADGAEPYLANQARAWAGSLDNFRYRALAAADLAAAVAADPALAASDVFLSGPAEALGPVAAAVLAAGLQPDRIRRFAC